MFSLPYSVATLFGVSLSTDVAEGSRSFVRSFVRKEGVRVTVCEKVSLALSLSPQVGPDPHLSPHITAAAAAAAAAAVDCQIEQSWSRSNVLLASQLAVVGVVKSLFQAC